MDLDVLNASFKAAAEAVFKSAEMNRYEHKNMCTVMIRSNVIAVWNILFTYTKNEVYSSEVYKKRGVSFCGGVI